MVLEKPRIVIIGAGMAGLTAANKLYKSSNTFELLVLEGGNRIGGRINTSDFCGDRIEQGATWIHGIEGSPVHRIAQEFDLLSSNEPWECMEGIVQDPVTVAEGGYLLDSSIVEPISTLFENLMSFIQGKECGDKDEIFTEIVRQCVRDDSVGGFLKQGLEKYWGLVKDRGEVNVNVNGVGNWSVKEVLEGVFAMHESVQRTYTSAGDLCSLDYNAESEYVLFPGEEITIAKGYSSVIETLASVLPVGMVQLGRKVAKIEWQLESNGKEIENGHGFKPVKLHFCDGSILLADHVIVTVSLGVLKHEIQEDSGFFNPPLPNEKVLAISRLGYGVVNKVFLQLNPSKDQETNSEFPLFQMVFRPNKSEFKNPEIPNWIRRTSFITPIYKNSRVLLSWFTGEEALQIESLSEEEITKGFETTVSNLLLLKHNSLNGTENHNGEKKEPMFSKVLSSKWGGNPLFYGSYSYIAVGSSVEDMETLSEPLPSKNKNVNSSPPLQILFAGEATHGTHYSTTHGAYFSGLREANRLLKHYNCIDD